MRALYLASFCLFLSACGDKSTSSEGLTDADQPKTWALATANPLATEAGAKILANGGSAVDAAVAVQAVLGLVEPQSSGLGGGAFMLFYERETGAITAYDGREVAPASATPTMFLKDDGEPMGFYDAVVSGYSVGVPGAVAMLDMAHENHGLLPWDTLFEDAQSLAEDGFTVSPRLSSLLARFNRFPENPTAKAMYYTEDGEPLAEGTTFTNPDYANTLALIADGRSDAFYTGPIAEEIVRVVNEKTGEETMTLADLSAYSPTVRAPVCGDFLKYEVCSMGPPSSGGVTVLQILGLFERAVSSQMSAGDQWSRYVEASRLAYADRALYLADPRAMGDTAISSDDVVNALISPSYLDHRAELIGDSAAEGVEAGDPIPFITKPGEDASPDLPGTSHFSILDANGNMVSMTTTVEFAFGSHLIANGFILNNQLTDFSFRPERDGAPVANAAGPGKKPRSSMSPVLVLEDGTPEIAIGSPGGPAIIGYVAKTLINTLHFEDDLQSSVDFPNIVAARGRIAAEADLAPEIFEALEAYGYTDILQRDLTSGLYGFRVYDDGKVEGAADARREGTFMTGTIE